MFCINCGQKNTDTALFCQSCGVSVTQISTTSASNTVISIVYAGFWQRFAALFIDGFILMLLSIPAYILIGLGGGWSPKNTHYGLLSVGYVLCYLISAIYFSVLESGEKNATLGKRWLGLKVYDNDGNRISTTRAFGRWASHLVSYITFYIGFLIQPFTEKKQALHDIVAGTIVVDTQEGAKSAATVIVIIAVIFCLLIPVIGIIAAISIPAYQDYTTKAKIYEGYNYGNQATHFVGNYFQLNSKIPTSLSDAGFSIPLPISVSDIAVNSSNAEIEITFSPRANALAGKKLSFIPSQANDGHIIWRCSSNEIQPKYLPIQCR